MSTINVFVEDTIRAADAPYQRCRGPSADGGHWRTLGSPPETGRAYRGVLGSSDAPRPLDPELRPGRPGVRPPSKGQRLTATPGATGVAPDTDFVASLINSYVVNRPRTQLNIS